MAELVTRAEARAYRLHAHGLDERMDAARLVDAAARCGVQNSPPGSALLALNARVAGVTPERMDAAVARDRTLLQSWAMRGAPFFFPTADAAVFTAGVLPLDEAGLHHLLPGLRPSLDELGMGLLDAVALCESEIRPVLSGRRLPIGPLGAALAERIGAGLPPAQTAVWRREGPWAAGQPLGEGIVHFCLRVLCLRGLVCFAPREGNTAPFVLVEEWIGKLRMPDPAASRAELLRRYLHAYGPSTRAGFAAWLGVQAGDVDPWWRSVADELVEVDFDGRAWMLAADLPTLRAARAPRGVRLLPPRDPYTQLRDRDTILARAHHRTVWKTVGEPGTVLADGEIAGIWRPRKRGSVLDVTVTPFTALTERQRRALDAEAEQLAPLRGADSVRVRLAD